MVWFVFQKRAAELSVSGSHASTAASQASQHSVAVTGSKQASTSSAVVSAASAQVDPSPASFQIFELLSRCCWELLYTDDLILSAESGVGLNHMGR